MHAAIAHRVAFHRIAWFHPAGLGHRAVFFWVMSSAYELDRDQLIAALERLLRARELVVEQAGVVWKALRTFKAANVDFAHCLIERSAAAAGCESTMTFDRAAAKGAGMTLLA
jgi:predicted nucleic-acid-binding protein